MKRLSTEAELIMKNLFGKDDSYRFRKQDL